MTGFLGTGATWRADLNLVVQVAMTVALLVGMGLARRGRFDALGARLDRPGTFPYVCEFHGDRGGKEMAGVVTVTPEAIRTRETARMER